ncbi:cytochrome C [Geobacter sp. DSM 9736]|uniref:cytochrome C n=1 Tax=Geobacter sp. DSM 9736 TaxID=1277350 RepID=UPI000B508277|nr:cytochrome C [Geobacter sp. DSM 9736]SNB47146.1 hypothetical protein SAMN06269301_2622 [Geobacter sp. DSM 9736]
MKALNVSLAAAATALLLSTPAMAFHAGGVAECEGCHTMHNSLEGKQVTTSFSQFQTGPYLLKGSDQSSACLNCHQHAGDTGPSSYHISTAPADMPTGTAPLQRTPGGDFGWLKKTYNWVMRGEPGTSLGERKGHNIVAADYGYSADSKLTKAPGGEYPAANLACSSCHDPHGTYRRDATGAITQTGLPIFNSGSYHNSKDPVAGKGAVGVFRILGGEGYQPKSLQGSFGFANTVPAAVAPSTYNQSEAAKQVRVAYGQGMSEWCANCHTGIIRSSFTSGMGSLSHPAGNGAKLGATIAGNYNKYVKSGDLTNTDNTKSFSSLVPFEEGTADYATLKAHASNTDAYLNGPEATANVNCLSCHRAHASGFDSMTRFGALENGEYFTVADASGNPIFSSDPNDKSALGRTPAEQSAALYDRTADKFAPYQRALCNKCHAKD